MKKLEKFAAEHEMKVVKITYRHAAAGKVQKRKGYDLVGATNNKIFASFEPCDFSNGDKWFLRDGFSNKPRYSKRITIEVLNGISWKEYPNTLTIIKQTK